jgi:hypothetical protein
MMRGEAASRVSVVELRRWQGDRADTTRMLAAYNRLPYRTRRSAAEFARVLRRPGQVVWLCDHATDGFGYISVTGGSQLAEYAGDPLAVTRLVRYLVSRRGVQVTIPPAEAQTELESILLSYAAGFTVVPVGMIRVVSLKRTLVSYARCLARRLAGWRGAFCLSVDGGEAVVCRGTGRRLLIETAGAVQGEERLGLGTQDLARLLFGPFPPALGAALDHEFLRRAFPLPIYLHALSHV